MKELFLPLTERHNYYGVYDYETPDHVQLDWGKYDYGVPQEQQTPDYNMLVKACREFNKQHSDRYYALPEYGDKYNSVNLYTLKGLSENEYQYEEVIRKAPEMNRKFKALKLGNKKVDDKIKKEKIEKRKIAKTIKSLTVKGLKVSEDFFKKTEVLLRFAKSFNYGYEVRINEKENKKFENLQQISDYLLSEEFSVEMFLRGDYNKQSACVYLKYCYINIEYYKQERILNINYNYYQNLDNVLVTYKNEMLKFQRLYFELLKEKELSLW